MGDISCTDPANLSLIECLEQQPACNQRKNSSNVSLLSASFARIGIDGVPSPTAPVAVPGTQELPRSSLVAANAEMVHTLEGHTGGVRTMSVSPDGKTLYSSGEDRSIRIWSMGPLGCSLLHVIRDAHPGWVWSLLVDPSGEILYSGSGDRTIRMWSLGEQSSPPSLRHVVSGHTESVCSLVSSKDGAFLYSGSDDRTIRVWDSSAGVSTPLVPLQILTGHTGYVSALCLSPDNTVLFSSGMNGDNSIKLWQVCGTLPSKATSRGSHAPPVCKLLTSLTAQTGIYTIALSLDGKVMYSGGEDRSIMLWSIDATTGTGLLLRSHEHAHDHWVRSLRLTPNGRILISGSADMNIGLWEVNLEGTDIRLLKQLNGHTDRVRCVRVSPDGDQFFSGSSDMTIRCWKLK
ncbi:hypothetical protein CEUSTIGMA_g5020.t1 [Chlamydomonas eustigma]|uniref:Uncharacterized protein n=1 Tax=Chlamydomonas eustigma TaxID=1157962 RepID=A0A250X3E5_9CHLO|nr:hypothetical protein CEUSTIGMA_g5020.t1 [Chlamydomonas eustigma]|eukprot:GAX77576.1 hypothetical protein CEUSTIGMA_g5020.t1 [Chlamydomonas eustigma]